MAANSGHFKKGQVANPTGKNNRSAEVLELVLMARSNCAKAIDKAVEIMNNGEDKVALEAAKFLRDTGIGRPSQVEFDLAQVSDERLIEEVRRRAKLKAEAEFNARVEQSRLVEPAAEHRIEDGIRPESGVVP